MIFAIFAASFAGFFACAAAYAGNAWGAAMCGAVAGLWLSDVCREIARRIP